MARELKITFDTGQTVTSAIVNSVGTQVGTPSMAESPASSGLYVGDFPALAAGTYDVIYSSGGYVVGGDTINWNGTSGGGNSYVLSTNTTVVRAE